MILMLTNSDGEHILINSECIKRAFRTEVRHAVSNQPAVFETQVVLRERERTHKRTDKMFGSSIEYSDEEGVSVSVQETVEEIFQKLTTG